MSDVIVPLLLNSGSASINATEAAEADALPKRNSDKDIANRRETLSGSGSGLVNRGFLKVGVNDAVASKTQDEADVNQTLFCYTTAASTLTNTLSAASASVGRVLNIGKVDSAAGNVTITRAGSDTILPSMTSLVLRSQGEFYTLAGDTSSTWVITAYYDGWPGTIRTLIPDPGNGAAIPVSSNGYCPLVSAGSETRTLAIPGRIGQELLLFHKTDGGSIAITVASAINQAANTIITMADVNDSIRLHAIDNNGTLCWRVVCNDGCALS